MHEIEKTETINRLLDFYEELLTDRQRTVMKYYFQADYSLAEIAEQLGISRNGVYDHIKRAIQSLKNYESKLHLVENYTKRIELYEALKQATDLETVRQLVDQLEDTE